MKNYQDSVADLKKIGNDLKKEYDNTPLKEDLDQADSIKDIKKFVGMMRKLQLHQKYSNTSIDIIKVLLLKIRELQARPPCEECGFDGGEDYHEAFKDFEFRTN